MAGAVSAGVPRDLLSQLSIADPVPLLPVTETAALYSRYVAPLRIGRTRPATRQDKGLY
jgi:hypothetical protein